MRHVHQSAALHRIKMRSSARAHRNGSPLQDKRAKAPGQPQIGSRAHTRWNQEPETPRHSPPPAAERSRQTSLATPEASCESAACLPCRSNHCLCGGAPCPCLCSLSSTASPKKNCLPRSRWSSSVPQVARNSSTSMTSESPSCSTSSDVLGQEQGFPKAGCNIFSAWCDTGQGSPGTQRRCAPPGCSAVTDVPQ